MLPRPPGQARVQRPANLPVRPGSRGGEPCVDDQAGAGFKLVSQRRGI